MEPTISTGSLILVDTDVVLYTEDIVTFQKQDSIITHRIVRQIDDQRFITKGDANDSDDPTPVSYTHLDVYKRQGGRSVEGGRHL